MRAMTAFVNWSGEQRCQPSAWVSASSEDDVVAAVRGAVAARQKLRVLGAGHSFSALVPTGGTLLSLDPMDRVLSVDPQRGLVRVQAGKRLRAFLDELSAAGLALPVVGSIDQQSLAGLVSTGTHGSSLEHGNLSAQVVALRVVTGGGELLVLDEGDPRLPAARLALGALGVITEITFRVVPAFTYAEHTEPMGFDEALLAFAAWAREYPYAKLWWLPHTDRAMLFRGGVSHDPPNFSERQRRFDELVVNRWVFPLVQWLGNTAPALIPSLNALTGAVYFQRRAVVGRPDRVMTLAMPPRHSESEWAVPVDTCAAVMRELRAAIDASSLRVNFIMEARLVPADDAWLSPAYGRDTVQVGTYITNPRDRDAFFALAERVFRPRGGRPHWGKSHDLDAVGARALYPRFDEFVGLARECDPAGTFRNPMMERLLG